MYYFKYFVNRCLLILLSGSRKRGGRRVVALEE